MRALRLLLGGFALLLLLAVAAVWLLPPLLDWDRYRDSIATLASEQLGRDVRIAGPISLALLPTPQLTAAGVSVTEGGDGITIRADQLNLRVGLAALAAGRIDARELVLRGAEMRVPWPLQPVQISAAAPEWFATTSVQIEDGQLVVGRVAITGIRARLTTDAFTGSYTAAGNGQISGRPWHFTGRLTRAGDDGAAGLDITVDGHGPVQDTGATLTGQLHPDGSFVGRIAGRGPDLSQLLPAPAVPFRAEGRVSISGGLAAADDLVGEIGGSAAKGAVALRVLPQLRLDVALAANRLDLDGWAPALLRGRAPAFPTGIDLSAEAAQLAGGTLRRLRGAFDIEGGTVAVRELKMVLPGDAALAVTGQVLPREGGAQVPRFEGDVTLSAPALRTTFAWLDAAGVAPFSALPPGVLRSAEMAGHAVLQPGQLALSRLDGTLDGIRVSGLLGLRTGERPGLAATLRMDRCDLDPWLPAALPPLAGIPARLARMDADLRLTAQQAFLRGTAFGPVALDAAVEGGALTLRRLDVTASDMRATLSGALREGGRIADGRLDLQAPSAAPLAGLLPPALAPLARARTFWLAPLMLQATASGAPEALGLRISGELGDLRLEAQPTLDLSGRSAAGVLTLRHPGAPRLLESLGIGGTASWLGDGSLGLVARLSGQFAVGRPARWAADSFDLSAGGLHANGTLALEADGTAPPLLSGRIVAETLPLPVPHPRSPEPLPIAALAGWRANLRLEAGRVLDGLTPVLEQAAATLSLAEGKLRLEGGTARLDGGTLGGSASLDVGGTVPALAVQATLTGATVDGPLFGLPVDLVTGRVDAGLSLEASGYSPAALLATLSGEARVTAMDGTLTGFSLASATGGLPEAALRTALSGGTTAFTRLDLALRARRGVMEVTEARMTGASGAVTLGGSVDLGGSTADLRFGLLPAVADPPVVGLRLNGPLDQLKRSAEMAAVVRWRAEHAARP
ncbi:AsmA family protein [Rhodovastum atsumiense]|uniref:AsmA family protein n=1 Tax=Rhodovastum atsumiense TaxID=504468 RepID=UPI00139F2AAE|nr:AsmA-like C-terminal region-containing protein [Rhodovastum atsumiense]CAH2599472.1 AsmA family protein [Rhodovastum atsumiense]